MRVAAAHHMCDGDGCDDGASAQGFEYGVKGGVTLGDLNETATPILPPSISAWVPVGGLVTWPLGGRLEFQPEALFTQKGAKADAAGGTSHRKARLSRRPAARSYRVSGESGAQLRRVRRALAGRAPPREEQRVIWRNVVRGEREGPGRVDRLRRSRWTCLPSRSICRGRPLLLGITDLDKETDGRRRTGRRSILAGWRF